LAKPLATTPLIAPDFLTFFSKGWPASESVGAASASSISEPEPARLAGVSRAADAK